MKRSALGKGLDSLISMDDIQTEGSSAINEIPISQITPNPDQPRQNFDEVALEELATSIRELGIIQPLTLRSTGDNSYQIISGERRYRAALLAGLGAGLYASTEETAAVWQRDLEFTPRMDEATRGVYMRDWHRAVERSLNWVTP